MTGGVVLDYFKSGGETGRRVPNIHMGSVPRPYVTPGFPRYHWSTAPVAFTVTQVS